MITVGDRLKRFNHALAVNPILTLSLPGMFFGKVVSVKKILLKYAKSRGRRFAANWQAGAANSSWLAGGAAAYQPIAIRLPHDF